MAVTVGKLFGEARSQYGMRLIGGKSGLDNVAEWVHIVEDKDVISFLRGQEVVFTAGILYSDETWFMAFVQGLHEAGASALVVNTGKYIFQIPEEVIHYCDREAFPLFSIPWETRMVDMTREFCRIIIEDRNHEESIASAVKNIVFGTGDRSEQVRTLKRYGFREKYAWTFAGISLDHEAASSLYERENNVILRCGKHLAAKMHDTFVIFHYREKIIFLFVNYSGQEIREFFQLLFSDLQGCGLQQDVHIGVGDTIAGPSEQSENFRRAFAVSCLARKRREKILYYRELGVYRLLLGIRDEEILKEYYRDTIGRLREYDGINKTKMYDFLRVYLEKDGSPKAVSDTLFIHRNTVSLYEKKVMSILGINKMDQQAKTELWIAYQVAEIIDEDGNH